MLFWLNHEMIEKIRSSPIVISQIRISVQEIVDKCEYYILKVTTLQK